MKSLLLSLLYRPLRVGWCIDPGHMGALREGTRRSFTLWGDEAAARRLADLFRVDCLHALPPAGTTGDAAKAFINAQPHRPWFGYTPVAARRSPQDELTNLNALARRLYATVPSAVHSTADAPLTI